MKYLISRLYFGQGKKVKTSVSIPEGLLKALEELSLKLNKSQSNIVTEVLDQFMVQMYQQGLISAPAGEEESIKDAVTTAIAEKIRAS